MEFKYHFQVVASTFLVSTCLLGQVSTCRADARASTTECEILVDAAMESEVIDATDSGSFLISKWQSVGAGHEQVFYWKNGMREKNIPRLEGYSYSLPCALGKNDTVACTAFRRGALLAFVWYPLLDKQNPLPLLKDHAASNAHAISSDGKAVSGFQIRPGIGTVPVVWTQSTAGEWSCKKLPVLHDDNPLLTSGGVRISPNGRIVVAAITVQAGAIPTLYKSETHMWTRNDDGRWLRRKRIGKGLAVQAVNDHGGFVGHDSHMVNGQRYPVAYVCTADNELILIGVLKGDVASKALDINNAGVVVGWSTDPYGPSDPEKDSGFDDPFIWTAEEGIRKIAITSTPSKGGHGSVTTITEGYRIGGRVTIVDELHEPAFTAVLLR